MRTPVIAACLLAVACAAAAQEGDFDSLLRASKAPSAPAPAAAMPDNGHTAPFPSAAYNIWSVNCHTEANFFTALASARGIPAGILACQGDPETSPAYHTANWAIEGQGRTCIYNWGQPCCWTGAASPPEIASGPAQKCAQQACGSQYRADQTRAMPAGKLVESPGPQVCSVEASGGPLTLLPGKALTALSKRIESGAETVRVPADASLPEGAVLTFTADRLDACLACCEQRGNLWSGSSAASVTPRLANGREDQFRRLCGSTCRNAFTSAGADRLKKLK